jgi:hypothetical protein
MPGSIGMGIETSNLARLAYTAREPVRATLMSRVSGSGLTRVQTLQQFFDGWALTGKVSSSEMAGTPA